MATKTIFLPSDDYPYCSETETPDPEMNVLEISTRSKNRFGKSLSPYNLQIILKSGKTVRVECAYQGSKVFQGGKQFPELYWGSPRDASFDQRIKGIPAIGYRFFGKSYPTQPKHAFFNFLYIISLIQRKDDIFGKLSEFDGYSDIYYSPRKDPNCQARAAAVYVSLVRQGLISEDTPSKEILAILVGDA